MSGRLRVVIAVALSLSLWVLARPAWAMPAGLCDDRGASAIAPPPALEGPDVGIERARAASSSSCDGDSTPEHATVFPGHRASQGTPVDGGGALAPADRLVVLAPVGAPQEPVFPPARLPRGERFRIERPPRD
jgi:hypothetical protein